ncbi:hypothetical protein WN944_007969 [Citrus x changshan-huyou]|uniref:Glutathione transferase GST 23 n=2 Tax=Citrus TaxID=2706 RepID=A0ACB8KPP2_CITSI|nr:glutathione transferase GST 23 [Citrus sinensis]
MAEESVKLLGYWASPFALRVKWALKLKGVHYEYVEENLPNKSPLLLRYNPVYKKIPVLVHNGKPLAESLLIIEYIDEAWKQNPLLPDDPYERANARLWAKFFDEKCVPEVMGAFASKGEEQEKAAKARENLKMLERALEGKPFFGGDKIGFLDIAVGWIGIWGRIVEEIAGVSLIDAETMPLLTAWLNNFLEVPVIKACIPSWHELLEHNKGFHKILTGSST